MPLDNPEQAAAAIRPVARPMSINAYKVDLAQTLVERTILGALVSVGFGGRDAMDSSPGLISQIKPAKCRSKRAASSHMSPRQNAGLDFA